MIRRLVALAAFLLIAICGFGANEYGIADERKVTFHENVRVGDTILPSGKYRVIHVMQGDTHLMFFRRLNARKGHVAVASARCTLRPLAEPAKETFIRFSSESGLKILTLMQFKGETAQHVFETTTR